MSNQQRNPVLRAGQGLARFHRFAREMVLTATDDGGTLLDLVTYEPGGRDRPIAVFERNDDGTLIEEWSLGAYVLGLQQGSKSREGILQAVAAIVATIFDGRDLDPELGIEFLYSEPAPATEAVA